MLVKLFFLTILVDICYGKCSPEVANEGPLRFTEKLTVQDFAKNGEYREVLCCAAGYDTILWYHVIKHELKQFPWFPCDFCEKTPALADSNKTLQIKSVGELDGGLYMCVATNSSSRQTISHNTTLVTYSCTDRSGPPLAIPPSESTYVDLGQTVTFTCKGEYGCDNAEDGDVMWYVGDWQEITNKRYNVTQFERAAGTLKGANLTITNVQEEDYNKVFLCDISTVYDNPPPDLQIRLRLKKKVVNSYIILLAALIPVFIFVVVSVILWCICRTRIYFFVKSKNCCCKRIPDKGNKKFHTFIYHIDDDSKFADIIVNEFKKRHYNVASVLEDIAVGEGNNERIMQLMDESFSVIIVIPTEDRVSKGEKLLLTNVITTSKMEFDPAFITLLLSMTKKDVKKNHYLYEAISGLFSIKLIHENALGWQKQEFYSKIQLRLPKPDTKVTYRHKEATQEEKPLLQTPTPTPVNVQNRTFDFPIEVNRPNGNELPIQNGYNPEMERQTSTPFDIIEEENSDHQTHRNIDDEDLDDKTTAKRSDDQTEIKDIFVGDDRSSRVAKAHSSLINSNIHKAEVHAKGEVSHVTGEVPRATVDKDVNYAIQEHKTPSNNSCVITGEPPTSNNINIINQTQPKRSVASSLESGYQSNSFEASAGRDLQLAMPDPTNKNKLRQISIGSPSSAYGSGEEYTSE